MLYFVSKGLEKCAKKEEIGMKYSNKAKSIAAVMLAICMALTMSFATVSVFAETGTGDHETVQDDTGNTGDTGDTGDTGEGGEGGQGDITDPGEGTEEPIEEPPTDSVVKVTRSAKILNHFGGTVTGITNGNTEGTVTIPYGEEKTFYINSNDGYAINKVVVDGVNKGAVTEVVIKGDGNEHEIKVYFSKKGLFIMLDAGHAGKYNKGIIKGYWESQMTWSLTKKLKNELEKYPGVVVSLTKKSLYDDPYIYNRGRMAKGYDLFISIHSNWSSAQSADYPLAIVSSKYKPELYKAAQPLGKLLAYNVKNTMKTKNEPQVWVKRLSTNGQDWYGVLRGCASVNVPGVIVEHSFHSNRRACSWLMKDANKNKMARNEAAIIANYYGFSKDGSFRPGKVSIKLKKGKKKIKISWKAVKGSRGYVIYRATSKKGKFKKIKVVKGPAKRSWSNTRLKSKKKYYYKVRAYSVVKGKNVYGSYSAVKGIKTK